MAQYGPSVHADSRAVRGRRAVAAWLVDHAGARQLIAAEAEALEADRRLIEGSLDFCYPVLGFAPLIGTDHLVLTRRFGIGVGKGCGGIIGVGARGRIRLVRFPLWLNLVDPA